MLNQRFAFGQDRIKRGFQQMELTLHFLNQNGVLANLFLDLFQLLLVHFDELQVFTRDIVVVLLHLTEGLLVVDHELVDVLVLALLDFVDLHFGLQGQLVF